VWEGRGEDKRIRIEIERNIDLYKQTPDPHSQRNMNAMYEY